MATRTALLCCWLTCASTGFVAAEGLSDRASAYEQFRGHFEARRFELALAPALRIVELSVDNPGKDNVQLVNALNNLGTTQLRLKSYVEAAATYWRSVRLIERTEGTMAPSLLNPLLGLGLTYQALGDHERAIELLRRAVDVSRRLEGLFTVAQLELLEPLVNSYITTGKVDDAERENKYLMQLAESAYGENDVRILPALDRLARWYEVTGRYLFALETHRRALQIVRKAGGDSDIRLVEPLRGIARTYRLEFINGPEPYEAIGTTARKLEIIGQTAGAPGVQPIAGMTAVRSKPREEGEKVLNHAMRVIRDNGHGANQQLHGDLLIDFGDWYLLGNDKAKARRMYHDAWHILSAPTGPGTAVLEAPVQLAYIPPPTSWPNRGSDPLGRGEFFVELGFTVNPEGRVEDVVTLASEVAPGATRAVSDALKRARYRPRFVSGEPVETKNLVLRQLLYVRRSADNRTDGQASGR